MPVVLLASIGLAAHVALHLFEPRLAITWSYAHLGRRPGLVWVALALLVVLPIGSALAWSTEWSRRPVRRLATGVVIGAALAGCVVLAVVARAWPAPSIAIDPMYLVQAVDGGPGDGGRWYLLLWTLGHTLAALRTLGAVRVTAPAFIREVNALFAVVALAALAGAARRLAATRGEAIALTLLAWSAFGTLQLTIGYLDVYPFALAITAVYLWTALGALQGDVHPLWPVTIAALAPFFYVGLVLLAPSVLVLAIDMARRGQRGRLLTCAVAAVATAGLATVPGFGRPFAWSTWIERVGRGIAPLGLSPTSALLPPDYMLSAVHAREVVHTLLLVDGVGIVLLVAAATGLALAGRLRIRVVSGPTLLSLVVLPWFAYLVAMDPIFGAFADWDLFSYGAAATSLLGGYAFVQWGRSCPRHFAVLLGVALAAAGIHLLARLNALSVDLQHHLVESPYHTQ